jgi:hypothetical protein
LTGPLRASTALAIHEECGKRWLRRARSPTPFLLIFVPHGVNSDERHAEGNEYCGQDDTGDPVVHWLTMMPVTLASNSASGRLVPWFRLPGRRKSHGRSVPATPVNAGGGYNLSYIAQVILPPSTRDQTYETKRSTQPRQPKPAPQTQRSYRVGIKVRHLANARSRCWSSVIFQTTE